MKEGIIYLRGLNEKHEDSILRAQKKIKSNVRTSAVKHILEEYVLQLDRISILENQIKELELERNKLKSTVERFIYFRNFINEL